MAAFSFYFPVPGTPTGVGYELSFMQAGTSTPQPVYSNVGLSVQIAQPIVFNADGQPDTPIFLNPTPAVKIVYEDENGEAVAGYPYDNFSPLEVAT